MSADWIEVLCTDNGGRTWNRVPCLNSSIVATELRKAKTWTDDFGNVYKRVES